MSSCCCNDLNLVSSPTVEQPNSSLSVKVPHSQYNSNTSAVHTQQSLHIKHQKSACFLWLWLNNYDRQSDTQTLCCHTSLLKKRAASLSRFDAQQLDTGVTGMEDLSSSKDLSIPQLQRRYGLPPITDKAHTTAQRWQLTLCITSKQCLHSNLRTLWRLALRLS